MTRRTLILAAAATAIGGLGAGIAQHEAEARRGGKNHRNNNRSSAKSVGQGGTGGAGGAGGDVNITWP